MPAAMTPPPAASASAAAAAAVRGAEAASQNKAIALVTVARVSDQAVLAQLADKSASREELQGFESAVAQLLLRSKKLPAYPGWKDGLRIGDDLEGAATGCVYALADSQALCIVLVAIRNHRFPERLAYGMLQEFAEKVQSSQTEEQLSEAKAGKLTGVLKGVMKELMKSYSDPTTADKVTEVHEKVDKVKGLMQDNVKKILETHVSLETLQAKSANMTASADQFLKQSVSLKQQVQNRNLRVKAAFAAVTSAVVLYLMMPLFS